MMHLKIHKQRINFIMRSNLMILCFDDLQPKQYIKNIKITIYMTIKRLYYLLTGVCTRFFANFCLVPPVPFSYQKSYTRSNQTRVIPFRTTLHPIFPLTCPKKIQLNIHVTQVFIECTFSCKYDFLYFQTHQTSFSEISIFRVLTCIQGSQGNTQ